MFTKGYKTVTDRNQKNTGWLKVTFIKLAIMIMINNMVSGTVIMER